MTYGNRHPAAAAAVIFFCCLLSSASFAEELAPSCAEIPSCYEGFTAAQALAKSGDNVDALRRFQSLYLTYPDPRILYPLAVLLQRLGRLTEASTMYGKYLASGVETDANKAAMVEEQLRLVQLLAAPIAPPQTPPQIEPKVADAKPRSPAPLPNVGLSAPGALHQIAHTPLRKRWWLWTMAGVVAAGVGAGIGAWFYQRSTVSVYRPFE